MARSGLSYVPNPAARAHSHGSALTAPFSKVAADHVRAFHQRFPQYASTPLLRLDQLAHHLRVARIWVKDESPRFGLKAFKVLGASYAAAQTVAGQLGLQVGELGEVGAGALRDLVLVTATDGNHGRAVAWAAEQLGCGAAVYMPRGSSRLRVEAIESHGARVTVIDGNYDDAVHLAAEQAQRCGWCLVQDTAWKGYTEVPLRVMQGYLTLVTEALDQLHGEHPTHVFVQCGVGSLAACVLAHLVERMGADRPFFAVVEPTGAACFLESMRAGDGLPHRVDGDLETIMAGLACGEPNILAWDILRQYADLFVACDDEVTEKGMRVLGHPLAGDPCIISGESGAVTAGLTAWLLEEPRCQAWTDDFRLRPESKILVISTEGDTDPGMYAHIVHGRPL